MITNREQAAAHQAKHFGPKAAERIMGQPQTTPEKCTREQPKPVKMTRPEKEFGMILEAMKRRGEIVSFKFQGMSLAWGRDPESGILMRYKCDFSVVLDAMHSDYPVLDDGKLPIKIIEVKGKHIFERDKIRFKGCRAEWPEFMFEMHQLEAGVWRRIL